eukprot:3500580-Pyramimonas_sp.AAC.1
MLKSPPLPSSFFTGSYIDVSPLQEAPRWKTAVWTFPTTPSAHSSDFNAANQRDRCVLAILSRAKTPFR